MLFLSTIRLEVRALLSRAKPGLFLHATSYNLEPIKPGLWRYIPNHDNPLTFIRPDGKKLVLTEPFETDLASTPRAVWWMPGLAPTDMLPAALVHDWLYQRHHDGREVLGFEESNRCLEEMCLAQGYDRCEAFAIREACDLFGRPVWDGKAVSP